MICAATNYFNLFVPWELQMLVGGGGCYLKNVPLKHAHIYHTVDTLMRDSVASSKPISSLCTAQSPSRLTRLSRRVFLIFHWKMKATTVIIIQNLVLRGRHGMAGQINQNPAVRLPTGAYYRSRAINPAAISARRGRTKSTASPWHNVTWLAPTVASPTQFNEGKKKTRSTPHN